MRRLLLILGLIGLAFANSPDGSCSEDTPCTSGCCSKGGYCGFGPSFCGSGNCTSTCDAVAECGQYAPAGQEGCPLNVCCSQFGCVYTGKLTEPGWLTRNRFCGTTSDFCGKGCQGSGCEDVKRPGCSSSGGTATKRTMGYYESWSYNRSCDSWSPATIDASAWTHLFYAFALIDPNTFKISQMNSFDTELYPQFTSLKQSNPSLKVFISVGGWDAGGKTLGCVSLIYTS